MGQLKKDLSDIKHLLKEAEKNETTASTAAPELMLGTSLLAEKDSSIDDIEDKIEEVKKNEENIKKYVPKEYQTRSLNSTKSELAALVAKLKVALAKEAEKEKNETNKSTTSLSAIAFLASQHPTGMSW